jgi:hypothetical protein
LETVLQARERRKFSMVVDGESVSVSVTNSSLPRNVPFILKPRLHLGPEQPFNGQSGEPQGTWASDDDADGSKESSHGSGNMAQGLHRSRVAPPVAVSNSTVNFCTGGDVVLQRPGQRPVRVTSDGDWFYSGRW